jgi:hypothetical protein
MADSADLVCLGGYFGTGRRAVMKGGMVSVFLMGCYDKTSQRWKTVCKCGNGFDDEQLDTFNAKGGLVAAKVGTTPFHHFLPSLPPTTPSSLIPSDAAYHCRHQQQQRLPLARCGQAATAGFCSAGPIRCTSVGDSRSRVHALSHAHCCRLLYPIPAGGEGAGGQGSCGCHESCRATEAGGEQQGGGIEQRGEGGRCGHYEGRGSARPSALGILHGQQRYCSGW